MYLTLYKQTRPTQNTIDYNALMQTTVTEDKPKYYKTTVFIENPTDYANLTEQHRRTISTAEEYIYHAWKHLEPFENNYEEQYYEFKIPKRSGGLRTINAPKLEFKNALTKVKDIFEQNLKCLAHDAAYAYIKQRSIMDALKVHQANNSQWFLKIDLKDFFNNCTPELIYKQLCKLYPFYYFHLSTLNILKRIIKTCCLHGGLPQGTPISPLLTNLVMIPYDYQISNALKRGTGEHYVYTRYADDILISSKSNFNWQGIVNMLTAKLAPFTIKKEKTRYGSKAGSNWNLGLMLNKDNNVTLGSNKKKTINAMLNNFIRDYKNNVFWSKEDVYQLQGHLSYLKQIEPNYYDYIVQKYEAKYNVLDYRNLVKFILN